MAEPIVWAVTTPGLPGSFFRPTEDEADAENREAYAKRFFALFEHYGVDLDQKGAAYALILALARDHVPGFQVVYKPPRKPGKPPKWKGMKSVELLADVQWLLDQGNARTARHACKILSMSPRYRVRYAGEKPLSLYQRYLEAPSNMPPLMQHAVCKVKGRARTLDPNITRMYALYANQLSLASALASATAIRKKPAE